MKQVILPEDAPFSSEQREWLNGYLSALIAPYAEQDTIPALPVTIAWGSQTGTAESLAKKFAKMAKKSGINPIVKGLDELDQASISDIEHLIVITSTYGDGEAPDNAQSFYDFMHSEKAPKLDHLKYAVLSIGDSSYPDFCQCGIDFDTRFKALGANTLLDRVDMDVEHDNDYAKWTDDMLAIFGTSVVTEESNHDDVTISKNNPYTAEITNLYNLNSNQSERETTHVEISLGNSGIKYEAGDALGVYPVNDPKLVQQMLNLLGFSSQFELGEKSLEQSLIEEYEIRNISIPLLKFWATKSQSAFLLDLIASDNKKDINNYLWGREIIDLIIEHPIDWKDPNEFLSSLKPLSARLYSIASSPHLHPNEIHLTVGVVKYNSYGRERKGVCSSYFSELSSRYSPRIFVHSNNSFRLPENSEAPVIMVGPGTGIAPFRAFLEERIATQAVGDNWLFFGNPYRKLDYLYEERLEEIKKKGHLKYLSLAFSRDQDEKVYVQHLMLDQGKELFSWLEKGGYFYVCGDASRMAKDVDLALHKIVEVHGSLSCEDAAEYVRKLKSQKRYLRDVY